MPTQTVTLTHVITNPDGSIEVGYNFDGYIASQVYSSCDTLLQENSLLLVDQFDAVRFMVMNVLASGYTPETMHQAAGKVLTVSSQPSMQLNVSFG